RCPSAIRERARPGVPVTRGDLAALLLDHARDAQEIRVHGLAVALVLEPVEAAPAAQDCLRCPEVPQLLLEDGEPATCLALGRGGQLRVVGEIAAFERRGTAIHLVAPVVREL